MTRMSKVPRWPVGCGQISTAGRSFQRLELRRNVLTWIMDDDGQST